MIQSTTQDSIAATTDCPHWCRSHTDLTDLLDAGDNAVEHCSEVWAWSDRPDRIVELSVFKDEPIRIHIADAGDGACDLDICGAGGDDLLRLAAHLTHIHATLNAGPEASR